MSYPHLFPSGFLEFQDDCSGPRLYRNQPSRESDGVRLNDWLQKYATGQYKGGDFLRLSTNMRNTSRMWKRLPDSIKKQFLDMISSSSSPIKTEEKKEFFGDTPTEQQPQQNNKMSIFVITIVSIVAIIIGFLIACVGN